jgi:hypothetical protein
MASGSWAKAWVVKPVAYTALAVAAVSLVMDQNKTEDAAVTAAQVGGWSVDLVITEMIPEFFGQIGNDDTTKSAKS